MKFDSLPDPIAPALFIYELVFRPLIKRPLPRLDSIVWFIFMALWVGLGFLKSQQVGITSLSISILIAACHLIVVRLRRRAH